MQRRNQRTDSEILSHYSFGRLRLLKTPTYMELVAAFATHSTIPTFPLQTTLQR